MSSVSLAESGNENAICQQPEADNDELSRSLYQLETLDEFDAIIKRGYLRALLVRHNNHCQINVTERRLLEEFSASQQLSIKWHYVDQEWDLLPALLRNDGDLIVGQHNEFSPSSDSKLTYSSTWANASFQIVQRVGNGTINKFEDLAGRQLAAYRNTPQWNTLEMLTETIPGFVLQEISTETSYEVIMQRVLASEYDLALVDSLFLDDYLPQNRELVAGFTIEKPRSMAWGLQAKAIKLKEILNQYLTQQHITHQVSTIAFDDFSEIKRRGILRVITSTNPLHYYLKNGKLYGFEYELIMEFAKQHRLRVDVIVAKTQAEMFKLLREGKGDIIAASLPSDLLEQDARLVFSSPYSYANPVLIGRDNDEAILDVRELDGRRVSLPADSPYWDFMLTLQEQGAGFELVRAETGINMEGTLLMVALGMYDLTVIGHHQYKPVFSENIGVTSKFNLAEPVAHRWAMRSDNPLLLRAINHYVENTYRSEFYNIVHAQYFEHEQLPDVDNYTTSRVASLSPYDNKIQQYAYQYGFDWRLITALMFQESQFDPKAESEVGAEGLMQLIPTTAELLGVENTQHPETSINAGIRYLDFLRSKFDENLLQEDRMWFSLASYNAGYGHVKRARKLTEEMGLDKDKWFNNVELAMLNMAKPYIQNGEQRRICRCGQTVVYVREIRTRYYNYIRLTESLQIASVYNNRNFALNSQTVN
ncbi:MAG: transporter substrate-binding domain-containing protein [Pseudomonadota bacterium]